jgi:probable F420-dependent oxidoreductase
VRHAIFAPNFGPFGDPRALVELGRSAEQAGWDGLFLWDHIQWDGSDADPDPASGRDTATPLVDPWVALGAVAATTERLRLGTMITPLARRRPWKLARETVTLDRLSGGRVNLGVGLGFPPRTEFETFGEVGDPRERAVALDEGLAVLDGLWSGEELSYAGRRYSVDGARFQPEPVQRPRIPVWCAGWWPNRRPFRRAARWDGVIPELVGGATPAPADVAEIREFVQGLRETDAPFDLAINGHTDPGREGSRLGEYEAAGTTWWLERFDPERFSSLEQVRGRILTGPV